MLELITTLEPAISSVHTVGISPDQRWVASAGGTSLDWRVRDNRNWSLRIYELPTRNLWKYPVDNHWHPHKGDISSLCFSSDSSQLFVGSADSTENPSISGWDVLHKYNQFAARPKPGNVFAMVAHPSREIFFTAHANGMIRSWFNYKSPTGPREAAWQAHHSPILTLCISPNGQYLYSGAKDHLIRVWDSASCREVLTLKGHDHDVRSLAISPDGQILVSGSYQRIKIWGLETGSVQRSFYGHADWVRGLAITPDQRFLLSVGDPKIKIWDLGTGQKLRTIAAHDAAIRALALSQDGSLLVTGSADGIVKIWQVQ